MMHFLVFQHMPWERPGYNLLRAAKNWRVRLDIVELWHEPIPDIAPYKGIIVLGGTPNVDQEEQYPFLRAEKENIRLALEKDKAYLGFCLGHQLLADALGAHVGPNFCTSIGFVEGRITKEGREHPLFQNMSLSLPLLKWHTQAVLPPLPKDVDILVTSKDCVVEAISVQGRPHVVGMQFDNHVAGSVDLKYWVEGDRDFLASKKIDLQSLMRSAGESEHCINSQFDILFENYLKIVS